MAVKSINDLREFDLFLKQACGRHQQKLRDWLAPHRLTLKDARVHRVLLPMVGVYTPGWQALPACSWGFVELVTDQGLVGTGEWSIRVDDLALDTIERLKQEKAKNLLDADLEVPLFMAWWDLVGQVLQRPLVDLWGELFDVGFKPPRRVPLAAYSWQRFPDSDGHDAVTFENWPEFCRKQVCDEGYRHLKISMTSYQPEDHISIIERVREAVGPDITIRVDPHGTWNFQEAKRIIRAIEPFGIEYIEEPIHALLPQCHYPAGRVPSSGDGTGFQAEYYFRKVEELRKGTTIPISCHWWTPPIVQPVGGNPMQNQWEFHWNMIERYDPVDISVPDIGLGAWGLWRLLQMARFMGLHVTMHSNFELGLQSTFRAAMYSALGSYPQSHGIYLGIAPRLCHPMDTEYNQVRDDVLVGGKLPFRSGHLELSDKPGHGLQLDPERLARYAYTPAAVAPHRRHAQRLYDNYMLDRPRRTTVSGWSKDRDAEHFDRHSYPYDVSNVLGVDQQQQVDTQLNT